MLIRDAEISGTRCDVRIAAGRIIAIGPSGEQAGEPSISANGAALLPGLWDHHIHLNATAAALGSVRCGPPAVHDLPSLAAALHAAPGSGWLRAIDYHPATSGTIDRPWLDRHGPARPVRVQHRGGRMWVLNTLACAALDGDLPADGRLIDRDDWLRARLTASPPDLAPVGRLLAARGVTGLTEVTPRNTRTDLLRYRTAGLPQRLRVMGTRDLDGGGALVGEVKLHHHDHALPALDALTAEVAGAHAAGRAVAAHCVTRAELFLTLAAIEAAGPRPGDRIEHAAVAPPEAIAWIAALGLTVVTQPHFLAERAAAYAAEVDEDDRPLLYRLAAFQRAGIPLAAGSDAPFGGLDPWAAMAAAVHRPPGFGADEALTPEQALALYLGDGATPGEPARALHVGSVADLCLLDRPWAAARRDLAAVQVARTWVDGALVHDAEALPVA